MKQYTVAILGCGTRGKCYAQLVDKKEDFTVAAVCDINPEQIVALKSLCPNSKNIEVFYDENEFLKEKRADAVMIATPDRDHVRQAIAAMELGYDLLLEKPISDDAQELKDLLKVQQQTGRKVIVCHELRYGKGFQKCGELLESGIIGRVYAIDASERVAYWHWAQAYVRGIGASLELGHPAILAKCSHDLDLLQSYAKSECDTLSSVGDLSFFIPENAPENAADRCVDCVHMDTCPYSAKRIYIDAWHQAGEPTYTWPYNKATIHNPITEENLYEGIRNGEYGRCAFKCVVEKVDHQLVQMTFKNGVKASLKMVYAAEPGRKLIFYGTLGEIVFDERTETIEVMPFGKEKEIVDIATLLEGGNGHGGGDAILIDDFCDMIAGRKECSTTLKESLESHFMGIAADESRKQGGVLMKVHS